MVFFTDFFAVAFFAVAFFADFFAVVFFTDFFAGLLSFFGMIIELKKLAIGSYFL